MITFIFFSEIRSKMILADEDGGDTGSVWEEEKV